MNDFGEHIQELNVAEIIERFGDQLTQDQIRQLQTVTQVKTMSNKTEWKYTILPNGEPYKSLTISGPIEFTEKNHISLHHNVLLHVYGQVSDDSDLKHNGEYVFRKTILNTDVLPDKQIIVYENNKGGIYWEFVADHLARRTVLNSKNHVVSYESGFILGTHCPYGPKQGMFSSIRANGYVLWQRVSYFKPNETF